MSSKKSEVRENFEGVTTQEDPSWKANGHQVVDVHLKKELWIFGYGSLMWKVNFPFRRKVGGHVKGFARRFYQGSIDHRGVPEAPGRVCTLITDPEEVVWGYAYEVAAEDVPQVVEYLDFREKNGYEAKHAVFHPRDDNQEPFEVLFYIATPENPSYLGPAPAEELADHIARSVGPSGRNSEYLLNLAQAVRLLNPDYEDAHLFQLESLVKTALQIKS